MKKSLIPIIFTLVLGMISALSLSDVLDQIDSSLVILSSIFIIAFLIFNFSLSKIFKEQKSLAMVISGVLAFLVIYGINSTGFDVPNFFFDLGISEDIILTIAPILILGGIAFVIIKFAKESLLIVGGFFILLSLFVEEKIVLIMVGVILIIIRFFIPKGKWEMKKKVPKS